MLLLFIVHPILASRLKRLWSDIWGYERRASPDLAERDAGGTLENARLIEAVAPRAFTVVASPVLTKIGQGPSTCGSNDPNANQAPQNRVGRSALRVQKCEQRRLEIALGPPLRAALHKKRAYGPQRRWREDNSPAPRPAKRVAVERQQSAAAGGTRAPTTPGEGFV